ncbi:MAG: hypothetical protein HUJ63_02590 [Enterococcus sp.]|nr:hypothetical protein [Enterococcus sp.]
MGSTGHSLYNGGSKSIDNSTFGIAKAVVFKGQPPANSGIKKPNANMVTLKVSSTKGSNVLFQFKLSKDNKIMSITGFRDGVPEVKCKVDVDSGQPSLDKVVRSGSKSEKLAATKMKNLMQQSTTIKENQLGSIANELLNRKKMNK